MYDEFKAASEDDTPDDGYELFRGAMFRAAESVFTDKTTPYYKTDVYKLFDEECRALLKLRWRLRVSDAAPFLFSNRLRSLN